MSQDKRLLEVSESVYQEGIFDNSLELVSVFVMAPVMYCYVQWVLKEAIRTKKKRLYFLARDGYSMYCVAKEICRVKKLDIECRYFYCSRYALRSAQYFLLGEKSLDYICLGGIDVTFSKLMKRAGLTKCEAEQIAERLGYQKYMQVPMSYGQLKTVKSMLCNCKEFMKIMSAHAEERFPMVCGYLRQEGFLEDVPYAIVDSGWTGNMQKSIRHLLHSMSENKNLEGYYFGMYEYPKEVSRADYHCYYFSPSKGIKRKVYFCNSLFECIYSSPEAMTVGYRIDAKRYYPIFERDNNPNKEKLENTTSHLVQYTKKLLQRFPNDMSINQNRQRIVFQLLRCFMGHPTREEAKWFGSYIFCDDVLGEEHQTIATPLSYEEMKENHILHKTIRVLTKSAKQVPESAWPEGSTVLVEKSGKYDLRQCALYKYVMYLRKMMK